MGTANKIASAAFWSILVNVTNALYGFVSVPLLINYFGKAEYGLIGLAMSINVYMQLMDLGFNSTNVRFFSVWLAEKKNNKVLKLFQTSLAFYGAIGLINCFLLVLLMFFSQGLFNVTCEQNIILHQLLLVLAVTAFISWYTSCFEQIIKATENVAWIQRLSLLPKVLMIIVLAGTIVFKLSIINYFILTTLSLFAIIPFEIKKIKKEVPFINFKPKFDTIILKEIMPYCLSIFSFGFFQFLFYNLRPVFLGIQGSVEDIAEYRVLNGIATIVTMIGGVFMGILLPTASKYVAQSNKVATDLLAYTGTKYLTCLLSFCIFGLISVDKELVYLYVGPEFEGALIWLDLWLLFTFGNHNQCLSSLIFAGSDVKSISYMSSVSSIIGLASTWLFIPSYGVGGAVIAMGIYVILQTLFFYLYYWPKKLRIDSGQIFTNSFLPPVLVGLLAFLVSSHVPMQGNLWTKLFLKGIIFGSVFALVLLFFLNKKDKSILLKLLKRT